MTVARPSLSGATVDAGQPSHHPSSSLSRAADTPFASSRARIAAASVCNGDGEWRRLQLHQQGAALAPERTSATRRAA